MSKTVKWILTLLGAAALLMAASGIGIGIYKLQGSASTSPEASSSPTDSSPVDTASSGGQASLTSNAEAEDGAYIVCDITSINLTMSQNDTEFPYAEFTATLINPDLSLSNYVDQHLAIVFPDTAVNDYFDFYTHHEDGKWRADHSTGSHVIFNGRGVRLVQKLKAPLVGGYSANIYVVSPYYDYSLVSWPISVRLTTTA